MTTADNPAQRREPTAEEIRQACREIQSGWDAAEELKRRTIQPSPELDYGRVVRLGE